MYDVHEQVHYLDGLSIKQGTITEVKLFVSNTNRDCRYRINKKWVEESVINIRFKGLYNKFIDSNILE